MKLFEMFLGHRAPRDLAALPSAETAAREVVCRHKELAWRMGPPVMVIAMLSVLGTILSSTAVAPCLVAFMFGPRIQAFWYSLIARWHLQVEHKISDPGKEDYVALALKERIDAFFEEVTAQCTAERASLEQLRIGSQASDMEALLAEVNDRLALIKSEQERISGLTHDLRLRARSIGVRIKGTPVGLADLHASLVNEWALCLERLEMHHCLIPATSPLRLLGR